MNAATRPALIEQHVLMATTQTGLSMDTYAITVVELYQARTPDAARRIEFHLDRADPYKAARANAQLVRRMFGDGPVRMPSELEEALVLALPEPFRGACQRDLAARYGLLAAPLPSGEPNGQMQHVATLVRTAGDALAALAPMLEDGALDFGDAAHAPAALRELEEHLGVVTTLVQSLRALQPGTNVLPLRVGQ